MIPTTKPKASMEVYVRTLHSSGLVLAYLHGTATPQAQGRLRFFRYLESGRLDLRCFCWLFGVCHIDLRSLQPETPDLESRIEGFRSVGVCNVSQVELRAWLGVRPFGVRVRVQTTNNELDVDRTVSGLTPAPFSGGEKKASRKVSSFVLPFLVSRSTIWPERGHSLKDWVCDFGTCSGRKSF